MQIKFIFSYSTLRFCLSDYPPQKKDYWHKLLCEHCVYSTTYEMLFQEKKPYLKKQKKTIGH